MANAKKPVKKSAPATRTAAVKRSAPPAVATAKTPAPTAPPALDLGDQIARAVETELARRAAAAPVAPAPALAAVLASDPFNHRGPKLTEAAQVRMSTDERQIFEGARRHPALRRPGENVPELPLGEALRRLGRIGLRSLGILDELSASVAPAVPAPAR